MDKKAIVMISGGIDSAVLLAYAAKEYGADNVAPITFMYGQRAIIEVANVNEICKAFGVRKTMFVNLYSAFKHDCALIGHGKVPDDLQKYGEVWELPLRNVVFAALAASNSCAIFPLECDFDILIGIIKQESDSFVPSDASPEFIATMNALLEATTYGHCHLVAPFADKTKDEVIMIGAEMDVPLDLTYSCYQSGQVPCGKCGGCLDRARAFDKLQAHDPYYTYKENKSWTLKV